MEDDDEPPGKPATPTVSDTTESSLTVIWEAPANTGPDVTNYFLQYRDSGSYTVSPDSSVTRSRVLGGLRSGRTYQFRVQAKNDEGKGPWSNTGSGRTLTAPTVSGVAFTSTPPSGQNGAYKQGDVMDVTVTFNEAVSVTGTPQIDLTIGATERRADYESGSTTATLLFQYAVADTDEDENGASVNENGLKLNGGSIFRNNSTIHADLAHTARTNQSRHKVDGKAPTLVKAEVEKEELALAYVEGLDGDPKPAASDFAVNVDDTARGVTDLTMHTSEVGLTLATEVTPGQTVTLSYTPGTSPIRDLAQNPAGALSNLTVANRTPTGNVCGRTAQVRNEIVRQAPVSTCAEVAPEHMAAIEELYLYDENVPALKAGDFADLTGLELLDLGSNSIGSLPANLFSQLESLVALDLSGNSLAALQANAFFPG